MANIEPLDYEARVRRTEELKALGFDPKNPAHRVAVKIAERYELDLLMKELIVIPGKGAYITRDGLLSIAHRSGQLDGIVLEEEGSNERDGYWRAVVSVYRKDMKYPFRYPGRYPFDGKNRQYGPEMAIKVAESMALRRAFRISGLASVEESYENAEPLDHDPDDPATEQDLGAIQEMPDGITDQEEGDGY